MRLGKGIKTLKIDIANLACSIKRRNCLMLAEGERAMKRSRDIEGIKVLNDTFRQTFVGGRVMLTLGVRALEAQSQMGLLAKVKSFADFGTGNDPHGEHDFGAINHHGTKFFWKLDLYDLAMNQGSVDPANAEATLRVLTIMRADEY
jgi:hypothetical protein